MNTNIINHYKEYIKTTFGELPEVLMLDDAELKALPLLLRANYDFYYSTLLGIEIVLLATKEVDSLTPVQMEKHSQMASESLGKLAIIIVEHIHSYNIDRLITRRVNFVVPGKQAFIPQMLTHITKPKAEKKVIKQIPPLAQVIVLRQLLKRDFEGKTSYELVETLNSSYPTVNRAVNWLSDQGAITMEGTNEKTILFGDYEALKQKALQLCVTPIKRVVYTDAKIHGITAGVNALAQYSMINEEKQQCFAMTSEQLRRQNIPVDSRFGDTRIEVWRYNPNLLTNNDIADPLSVFFSLKDNQDERIQIELEHLITKQSW